MNYKKSMVGLMLIASLAACDQKKAEQSASIVKSADASPTVENPLPTVERQALAPRDQYVAISLGTFVEGDKAIEEMSDKFRRLYWSAAEPDEAVLAYDFIHEYRKEKDSFKQGDIIKANAAKLDEAYKANHGKNLFALKLRKDDWGLSVGKYDPTTKGFELQMKNDEDGWSGWSKPKDASGSSLFSWGVRTMGVPTTDNQTKFIYAPKDEAEARRIEGALATFRSNIGDTSRPSVVYLGHPVGSGTFKTSTTVSLALLAVDGIELQHPKTGEVLFTLDRSHLGKNIEVFCKSSLDILKLQAEEPKSGYSRVKFGC